MDIEDKKRIEKWYKKPSTDIGSGGIPVIKDFTSVPNKQRRATKPSPEQEEAIKTKDKARLVVSSAGAGKTSLLTDRVIHLVTERDVDPQRILLLTFTVKAAEEMRERVAKKLGEDLADFIECGTFHSWAHRILRRYHKMLDLHKDFSILDSSDSLEVWVKCANAVYGQGSKRGPLTGINNLYGIYSVSRNKEIPIEEVVQEKYLTTTDKGQLRLLSNKTRKIAKEYAAYKKKHSMLDFDDFLQVIQIHLGDNQDFRKEVSSKYDYILVDEVQDCNGPQIDILKKLIQGSTEAAQDAKYKNIKKPSSLFACGDEAQSIYGFRGADFKNMLKFPEVFKANVSMLVTNYRSTQEILDLANAIGRNFTEARWEKQMKGTYHGTKPYYVRLKDETAQAEFVANTIEHMVRVSKFPGREIAVLFRSNSMSSPVEMALNAKGLHFNKKSGISIFEMSHIKDILAFLKACYYHDDILSWTRMLELLPKVGVHSAEKIYTQVAHSDNPYALLCKNKHDVKADTSELGDLLREVVRSNKNPVSAVDSIVSFLKPVHEKKFGDKYDEKKSSINALAMYAKGCKSIRKMLVDLTLNAGDTESKNDKIEEQIERHQGGRITLASCHAMKGLEFNNVFIINCIDGKFPSDWFMFEGNIPKETSCVKVDPEKLDSERRLFYVACTRARHNLILTNYMSQAEFDCYRNSGFIKDEYDTESRFLSEIENLEDLVTVKMHKVSNTNKRLNSINSEYE